MPRFMYSALRFVPDPMKGEFVNIGLIVGSDDEDQWAVRVIQRTGRATGLRASGSQAWSAVAAQVASLQVAVDDYVLRNEGLRAGASDDLVSEAWLLRLASDYQNMLQLSRPMPVVGEDVDDVLDELWRILIEEPDARRSPVSKSRLRAGVTQTLRGLARSRGGQVATNATLRTGDTSADIDIATYNGSVAHLTQCYSFDVADLGALLESVKAWGWTVRDLREGGGVVSTQRQELQVERDVRIAVVCYAPDREESKEAFREAKSVFEDQAVGATLYDEQHGEEVAKLAASLLGGH